MYMHMCVDMRMYLWVLWETRMSAWQKCGMAGRRQDSLCADRTSRASMRHEHVDCTVVMR